LISGHMTIYWFVGTSPTMTSVGAASQASRPAT
jgi:hypothetical protein